MGRRNKEEYDDDDVADDAELEKLQAPADFDGPVEQRHCTDVLILLLLFGMWIAMTGIGIYAISEGDYRKVLYPLDYDGNICGTDLGELDMSDYPLLLYVNSYSGGVCVKDCPKVKDYIGNASDIYTMITYGDGPDVFSVSGSQLNGTDFVSIGDYQNASDAVKCTDELCFPDTNDPTSSWTSTGVNQGFGFSYYAGDTYEVLWRCYYTVEAEDEIQAQVSNGEGSFDPVNDANAFFNRLYADLYVARWYILGFGFGVSTAVALGYIFLMRMPFLLKTVVWTSILLTIALFLVGGYYTYQLAEDWDNEDPQTTGDNTILAARIASIVLWAIGGLLFILACCLRKQIAIAIGCVKTAGKAVNHMFLMLGVPVLQAVGLVAFFAVWLYYAVYLASLGDITTTEYDTPGETGPQIAVREYEWSTFVIRAGWYLLFCLYWTANFVVAVGDMIIALAVAKYYFTRNKMKIGSWTVISATWAVLRYHAGTCAYGALLIAIVQLIRSVIAKAQRAAKNANNKLAQCLLCCCQCCFCMLECCLRFISKNAYIQTAIFGTAFCKSCRKAFFLIARNIARVAAITYVSGAVLIIGKLFIAAITTLTGYYFITEDLQDELNSTAAPTAVIFLISYWVSDFFMDVFDMAITAVLHCFIADEEMFPDDPYAQADLRKYIDENGAEKD